MLNVDDTIMASSTASLAIGTAGRTIIRLSGPQAFAAVSTILCEPVRFEKNRVVDCRLRVDNELQLRARLYCFAAPHSYTGQDLCEIHLEASPAVVECVMEQLFTIVRPAGPGEFTKRAYLHGKLDLTQAEAVAEIVSCANAAQLDAAQRLLSGRFSQRIGRARRQLLDLLGRLEAGLDFAEEAIEFISKDEAIGMLAAFKEELSSLLENSIQTERLIDLDSVGLAGLPNAGKSSLLNALLGRPRSIVSPHRATTRDVLTGTLKLQLLDCVLFDCAGLLPYLEQRASAEQLSHQAAIGALNCAALVLFCVDLSKTNVSDELLVRKQITAPNLMYLATKADTLSESEFENAIDRLQRIFGADFMPVSAKTGRGLAPLKHAIETRLLSLRAGDQERQDRLTINQRHRGRLRESVKALADCAEEIKSDSTEVAAMLLRQAYEALGGLEHENIDEAILDRIFASFCIGK
ncbi:MAG: 50S ribosome-binding GTPase [Planctomycetaceae bacterium]|nr:50S ribosome-binding GTPase [Planctomycetaceae bacterium]